MQTLLNIVFICLGFAAAICLSIVVVAAAQDDWALAGFSGAIMLALTYIGYAIHRVRRRMIRQIKDAQHEAALQTIRERQSCETTCNFE